MKIHWLVVSCLLVLLSVEASKKSKKSNEEEEEEDSRSTDTDSDGDVKKGKDEFSSSKSFRKYFSAVFIPRERASIFLSYNECMRRMNCGVARREECSEECAGGKDDALTTTTNDLEIRL